MVTVTVTPGRDRDSHGHGLVSRSQAQSGVLVPLLKHQQGMQHPVENWN